MDSRNLRTLERRARRKYEWARLRQALVGFGPALVIVAAACLLTRHPGLAATFGAALFAAGVLLLWCGRNVRRAVLPGVAVGVFPLVLALCANHMHSCHDGACMSFCLPACALGGLGAGIGVATIAQRGRHDWTYWAAASGLALLTGAMGSSCAGAAGVLGLLLGFALGLLSMLIRATLARRAR